MRGRSCREIENVQYGVDSLEPLQVTCGVFSLLVRAGSGLPFQLLDLMAWVRFKASILGHEIKGAEEGWPEWLDIGHSACQIWSSGYLRVLKECSVVRLVVEMDAWLVVELVNAKTTNYPYGIPI